MKSIFRSFLAFAIVGSVSQAQAATCKEEENRLIKLCDDMKAQAPGIITKTQLKITYFDGGFDSVCYYTAEGETYSVPFARITCSNGTPTPTPNPTPAPKPNEIPRTVTEPAVDNAACQKGSIILTDNQVLGETIPVVGAKFNLAYFTNKVVGRKGDYKIQIPLAVAPYSSKLTHVKYTVKIDGKIADSKTVVIAPNLVVDYVWNGSATGKNIGSSLAEIIIEKIPNGGSTSFAVPVGSLQAKNLGFGGWVPTVYHFYDISRKKVLRGDGSSLSAAAEALGNQLRVIDSERSLVYIFDSATGKHLFTKSFWLGTDLFAFNHDANGLLVNIAEPFGIKTVFNRSASGDLVSITAPNGQVTQISLNANKYISAVTSPVGQIHSLTYYDADGLLKSFQKAQGQVSTFSYDGFGNLSQDAHSGGHAISLEKSVEGEETTILSTSQMGRSTAYVTSTKIIPAEGENKERKLYQRAEMRPDETVTVTGSSDDASILVSDEIFYITQYKNDERFKNFARAVGIKSVSGPTVYVSSNREESFDLSDSTNPFSIKNYSLTESDQNDEKTITNYDGATRTFVTQNHRGTKVTTKIDAWERLISVQVGNDLPKEFIYTKDKLTRVSQGTRFVDYIYDSATQNLASTKNVLGQATLFNYDKAGRLISTEYPDARKNVFGYDENNKLTGIVPAEKPQHNFVFNSLELLTSYSPPSIENSISTPTIYDYNGDKQLLSVTKPDGQKITYNYDDEKGTLNSIKTQAGVYTYNFNSKRANYDKIITPNAIETRKQMLPGGFLERDVLLKKTSPLGAYTAVPNQRNLVQRDVVQGAPDEKVDWVGYHFAGDGKIEVAGEEQIRYDDVSGRVIATFIPINGNFVAESFKYNSYGELSSYTAKYNDTALYSLSLEYDNLGRIVKKIETIKGVSQTYEYAYDLRNRLSEVKQNGTVTGKYNYDGNGNRISGAVNGQAIIAKYDSQDRLVAYSSESFEYNPNGELTSKKNNVSNQITPFTFNSFGQMTSVKVGSVTYDYEIDGFGRRIQNSVNGKLKDTYIYMDQLRLAGIIGSDGKVSQRFVYGTKSHVPDYFFMKGDVYRIITDHLGSVRLVVRVNDGSIVQEMIHDEFGKMVSSTGAGFQPFGFAGGLHDYNTNLIQFGARWYDSQVGRWISKDPIRFNGGDTNLYAYVGCNPINYVDPTGLKVDGPVYTPAEFAEAMNSPAGAKARDEGFIDSKLRYVYTKNGVMDMRHVQASYKNTESLIGRGLPKSIAEIITVGLGFGVEMMQSFGFGSKSYGQSGSSAFSAEDLPSNSFGAQGASGSSTFDMFMNTVTYPNQCKSGY